METPEFQKMLAQKDASVFPSVMLFEGEEAYTREKALADLEKILLPPGLEDMNRSLLNDPSVDEIIAAAETLPMLADRRMILIRDYAPLVGRSEAEERLLDYLPTVPPSSVVLFYCTQKTDKRKKLFTLVKKLNGVVSFAPMSEADLVHFVAEGFRELGRTCDSRTAEQLIFTCGTDATLLRAEIAKIAAHSLENTPVTQEEVTALATPSTECTVFQMVDAVVSGQSGRAFHLMRNLVQSGTERVFIISMLLRQFRLLQHVKIMQYEKKPREFIRNALGVPAFALDRYFRQAALFTGGQSKQAVRLCLDTEFAVKSGRQNQEDALETLMLKLLTLRMPAESLK